MSDIAICVEHLSKQYTIGSIKQPYPTLRDKLVNSAQGFFRRNGHLKEGSNAIWALRDVSFEVKQGEVIGVIGRNGAGKSTLLKILSRITEPTAGRATIHGRVASLLEVGTGFHGELTGRENVYLNGALLGMSRAEITRKFDEIVDFSGVERFIDTPVKHYSSGMKVRLAFSVAAHLEPEILLVDEVLAVGDLAFQKRCLGKMGSVVQAGRTVLFVSHNMAAVSGLCPTGILLEGGAIAYWGETSTAMQKYIRSMQELPQQAVGERTDRQGSGAVKVLDLWLENSDGQRLTSVACGDDLSVKISYCADQEYTSLTFTVSIFDDIDQRILSFNSGVNPIIVDKWPQSGTISCTLCTPLPLSPGQYRINVSILANGIRADFVQNALHFEVIQGDFFGTGKLPPLKVVFLLPHRWNIMSCS